MPFNKLDKFLLGAGATAAAGAYAGFRQRDPEQEDTGDRMKAGAVVGLAGFGLYQSGLLKPLWSAGALEIAEKAGKAGWQAGKNTGKVAWSGTKAFSQLGKAVVKAPRPVQFGLAGVASLGLMALGSAVSPKGTEQAGVETPDGDVQYVSPEEAESVSRRGRNVSQRMQSINAGGDLVFGLHKKRH